MSISTDTIPAEQAEIQFACARQEQIARSRTIEVIAIVALAALTIAATAAALVLTASLAGGVVLMAFSVKAKMIALIFSSTLLGICFNQLVTLSVQFLQNHEPSLSSSQSRDPQNATSETQAGIDQGVINQALETLEPPRTAIPISVTEESLPRQVHEDLLQQIEIVDRQREQMQQLALQIAQLQETQAQLQSSHNLYKQSTEEQLQAQRQVLNMHSRQMQGAIEQCIQNGLKEAQVVQTKAWHAIELSKKAVVLARQAMVDADISGNLDHTAAAIDAAETISQAAERQATASQNLLEQSETHLLAPISSLVSRPNPLYQS